MNGFVACGERLCSRIAESGVLARMSREITSPGSSHPLVERKVLAFFMVLETAFIAE